MRIFLCIALLCIMIIPVHAQDFERIDPYRHMKENIQFINDANGKPFKSLRGFDEEGSPYFSDNYIYSTIQFINGKTYHSIPIRINHLTGEVIFKMEDGQEMVMENPFKRIELVHQGKKYVFRSGFPSIDKQNELAVYELLDSGTAILLKYTSISFQDKQTYNSINVTRTYNKKETYYAWMPSNDFVRIPKKDEEWGKFFNGHQNEMDTFIKKEKIKFKKEEDIIKLFSYYNKMQQQVTANKN